MKATRFFKVGSDGKLLYQFYQESLYTILDLSFLPPWIYMVISTSILFTFLIFYWMDLLFKALIFLQILTFVMFSFLFFEYLGIWRTTELLSNNFIFSELRFSFILTLLVFFKLIIYSHLNEISIQKMNSLEYIFHMFMISFAFVTLIFTNNYILFYLALELQSFSFFLLMSLKKHESSSLEAAMRYFFYSAFFAGFMLFGILANYASYGTYDYSDTFLMVIEVSRPVIPVLSYIGFFTFLFNVLFKLTIPPFHWWAADVYEGTPLPIAQTLSIIVKIGLVGGIFSFFHLELMNFISYYEKEISIIFIYSLFVSTFGAYQETRFKRFLVYSSMVHISFIFITFLGPYLGALVAGLFYLLSYSIMNLGMWSFLLSLLKFDGKHFLNFSNLIGFSLREISLSLFLFILILSMSGLPPFIGFYSKLMVFKALMSIGHYLLLAFLFLATLVGSYYYARLIKITFFDRIILTDLDFISPVFSNIVNVLALVLILVLPGTLFSSYLLKYLFTLSASLFGLVL